MDSRFFTKSQILSIIFGYSPFYGLYFRHFPLPEYFLKLSLDSLSENEFLSQIRNTTIDVSDPLVEKIAGASINFCNESMMEFIAKGINPNFDFLDLPIFKDLYQSGHDVAEWLSSKPRLYPVEDQQLLLKFSCMDRANKILLNDRLENNKESYPELISGLESLAISRELFKEKVDTPKGAISK